MGLRAQNQDIVTNQQLFYPLFLIFGLLFQLQEDFNNIAAK